MKTLQRLVCAFGLCSLRQQARAFHHRAQVPCAALRCRFALGSYSAASFLSPSRTRPRDPRNCVLTNCNSVIRMCVRWVNVVCFVMQLPLFLFLLLLVSSCVNEQNCVQKSVSHASYSYNSHRTAATKGVLKPEREVISGGQMTSFTAVSKPFTVLPVFVFNTSLSYGDTILFLFYVRKKKS